MHATTVWALVAMVPLLAGCVADDGQRDDAAPSPGPTGDDLEQTGFTGFDTEPADCQRIVPPGPMDASTGLLTGYPTRTLDAVFAVDASFVALYEDWEAVVRDIAAVADGLYQRELGLNVSVVAIVPIPQADLNVTENKDAAIDGDQSQKIIDDTKAYFTAHYPDLDRDLVYTLVGTSTAGGIAGQADCIGAARYRDVAYGWGEGLNLAGPAGTIGPLGLIDSVGLKVILHEMAHLLGAHHHYTACGPYLATSGTGDAMAACDLMINDIGFASYSFSPLNKAAIRGYADSVDL